jgi:hypothetical protein
MRSTTYVVALTALAIALSACGNAATPSTTVATAPGEMSMDMNMGDPNATPAAQVAGAELSSGEFAVLSTAPPDVVASGEAILARHTAGTTVTLHFEGLPPDRVFMAHVHEGACHEAGGPHYRYDPSGSDMPPNEIHLGFSSDAAGRAAMTVENPQVADERARSVVVHVTGPDTPKLACADLDGIES